MRIVMLLFGLCLLTIVAPANAQYDAIVLLNDSLVTDCNIEWSENHAVFYIFHYSRTGTLGSQFRISKVPCMNFGGITGPTMHNPGPSYVGNIETGIRFYYDSCMTGWIYIAVVTYWDLVGLTGGNCCEQVILEHPEASTGQPEAFDCGGLTLAAEGISGFITEQPDCACSVPTGITDHQDTWGAIKNIYSTE